MSFGGEKITCPLCRTDKENNEQCVTITEKGATSINSAAVLRGENINVAPGTQIHVSCRQKYVNKKDIESSNKLTSDRPLRKTICSSVGNFNNQSDCLFCGQLALVSSAEYSQVKTDDFVKTIRQCCKSRNDQWSYVVSGRIEFFNADLHAADCVYHHVCSVNFRTGKNIPTEFQLEPVAKRKKLGRPKDETLENAFLSVCKYFEKNDEEQLTITDLVEKMDEILHEMNCEDFTAYSARYMKTKLIERYGDSIRISSKCGQKDIVTGIFTVDSILRSYMTKSKGSDDASQKRLILEAAAKLIKSDIKDISESKDEYSSPKSLNVDTLLDYVPDSLRFLLQNIFVGKDTSRKVAVIGQSIMQAARPRAIVSPLQIGLAVQLHYMFRSRFLIDSLYAMGLCSSYNEVGRFVLNAVCMGVLSPIGNIEDGMLALFSGDNADANIMTLDGKGTFHGMGLICGVTPKNKCLQSQTIPRKHIGVLDITGDTKIPIHQYHVANRLRLSLQFKKIKFDEIPVIDSKVDILWEMSFRYKSVSPNWSGMMHMIHENMPHPGKSSVYFLPLIDIQSSDKTCIYSTLRYICTLAHTNNIPAIITFDQPLYWKSREIIHEALDSDSVKDVIVRLGAFHMLMNLLGAIGDLMDGTGIRKLIETLYGDNAVLHLMTGKAVQRSFRAHLMLDKCITHETVSEIIAENPDFEKQFNSLEPKYNSVIKGEITISDIQNDETIISIEKTIKDKKSAKSEVSRTAKVWYLYQKLVQTARNLVKSDRSSSWKNHLRAIYDCLPIFAAAGHFNYLKSTYLYLMDMLSLKQTHPDVYEMFENGHFVIRRSDKFWAGLSLDLVIEQVLMRALKTRGGLTRGSGMTEIQRAIWTMSAPSCAEYSLAMQDFTDTKYITSDQHRESSKSRVERDFSDFQTLLDAVHLCEPISSEPGLRNIVTGMEASSRINVDSWEKVGWEIVEKMFEQLIFTYSFTKKDKVKNMASSCAVKVADDRSIDPALLFQRLLIVAQTGDIDLKDILEHELCPYPPALFESNNILRKADKPPLAHAIIKRRVDKSDSLAMQDFTDTKYITSDQHRESSKSRVERDFSDFQTLLDAVHLCEPISSEPGLRNIVTGMEASSRINVDSWEKVGWEIVEKMFEQLIFTYSFTKKDKVKNMASSCAVKVADDRSIDPALLFQRLLIVAQTGDIDLKDILEHELCPYPPALFESNNILRKADKPPLAHAIIKRTVDKSDSEMTPTTTPTDKFVLDGGSLLHRLTWKEGSTYEKIAETYADFTVQKYGIGSTVIFDGYNGSTIKDNTHQRRNPRVGLAVNVTENTIFSGKRNDFLSNAGNKNLFIQIVMRYLNQKDCHVVQTEGDADVEIVKAAVSMSTSNPTTLIGEDTDLLILLLYYYHTENFPLVFRSDKQQPKSTGQIYDIKSIKLTLGDELCSVLLFLHAFTGCDSTSRIFGIGKQSAFQKLLRKSSPLIDLAKVFCPGSNQSDVHSAGIKAMLYFFGAKDSESLTTVRYRLLSTKIVTSKTFVTPEKLPPTESATKFHSLRCYYQIMMWMGKSKELKPTDWGWKSYNNSLIPIMNDTSPIPAQLLNIVHCNCTTHCTGGRCSCRKYGMPCSSACGVCQSDFCENTQKLAVEEEDEVNDTPDI